MYKNKVQKLNTFRILPYWLTRGTIKTLYGTAEINKIDNP